MTQKADFPSPLKEAILEVIKKNSFPHNLFQEIPKSLGRKTLKPMFSMIKSYDDIMSSIKWLILLHNMIKRCNKGRQQQIDTLIKLIKTKTKRGMSSIELLLLEKLIIPYKNYLLKRNRYQENEIDLEWQPFILINLMKKAGMFIQVLFTLGRYLFRQHRFLSQFNLILAKDIGDLYKKLRFKITKEFCRENVEDMQALHQSMYIVFYNCYFSKFVVNYAPVWIDTQSFANEIEQARKINQKNHRRTISHEIHLQQCAHHQSIIIEDSEPSCAEFITTASTIHTNSTIKEQAMSDKEVKERMEFIQEASYLLGLVKEESPQKFEGPMMILEGI